MPSTGTSPLAVYLGSVRRRRYDIVSLLSPILFKGMSDTYSTPYATVVEYAVRFGCLLYTTKYNTYISKVYIIIPTYTLQGRGTFHKPLYIPINSLAEHLILFLFFSSSERMIHGRQNPDDGNTKPTPGVTMDETTRWAIHLQHQAQSLRMQTIGRAATSFEVFDCRCPAFCL